MAENFTKGIASINSLSRVCGADVFPIDIGIARDVDCSGIEIVKLRMERRILQKSLL